jgi:hypothetical protein
MKFVFVIAISVWGHEVTQVGPFGTFGACTKMQETISLDYDYAFEKHFPQGMEMDKWGYNAIALRGDYSIECKKVEID